MAKRLYEEANIQDIADAIREKNGLSVSYKVSQMAAAIRALSIGGGSSEVSETVIFPPTGSWTFSKVLEASNSYTMGSCDFSGDTFVGKCTATNTGAGIYSTNKINFTGFNTLRVSFVATGINSGQSQFSLYVQDEIGAASTDQPIDRVATSDEISIGVMDVDVSGVTGSYYVVLGVCTWASSRPGVTISNITLLP